ncbi:MAG: type 1 glutamine amidotransferase [Beijerinckiaceae bacterium]
MAGLKFLVVEGNTRDRRDVHARDFGATPGVAYGETLLALAPAGSHYDICCPADAGANLPVGAGLSDYDGIALTGSSLHLWNREEAVERQIELARAIFASRTAFFGSCWGVQMACVAAGGDVQKNVLGREIGFARNIAPTEAGRNHPLLAGRPGAYDAPAIHLDIITLPSTDCTVLASNNLTPVQAAEIRHDGGTFWGVQYHPEFSLRETAVIMQRLAGGMVQEGFCRNAQDAEAYTNDMLALHDDRKRSDLAWRLGLDDEVLDDQKRQTEVRNWISAQVQPLASLRGRG